MFHHRLFYWTEVDGTHQLHCVSPVGFPQGLVNEAPPATPAVLRQLCGLIHSTAFQGYWNQQESLPQLTCELLVTFYEVSDLGLHWSLLQVLDHHVCNPGQVTHVASPGPSLCPEIYIKH